MNLLRALVTVSGLTLVSRILGFARDFFIARAFGAGLATDAFFVAFRLPNLLRRLFAEGAFSQAFGSRATESSSVNGSRFRPPRFRRVLWHGRHVSCRNGCTVASKPLVSGVPAAGAPPICGTAPSSPRTTSGR